MRKMWTTWRRMSRITAWSVGVSEDTPCAYMVCYAGMRQAKDGEDGEGEQENNGEDGKRENKAEVKDEEEHEEE